MDRQDIELFLTLVEELHFGRTAERLRVTPDLRRYAKPATGCGV
jgi:hypothetical protein